MRSTRNFGLYMVSDKGIEDSYVWRNDPDTLQQLSIHIADADITSGRITRVVVDRDTLVKILGGCTSMERIVKADSFSKRNLATSVREFTRILEHPEFANCYTDFRFNLP